MSRFGRFWTAFVLVFVCGVATARAQAPVASDYPWSAQVDVAATFAHRTSSSVGGEVSYNLQPNLEAFLEAGRMADVATSDLGRRARLVGDFIGASSDPVQHVLYLDVGARYNVKPRGRWHPFAEGGVGMARVRTQTTFSVAGARLTPSQLADIYGVQLGLDLDGHIMKAFLMLGGGVRVPVRSRYFVEGTYRYGYIFSRRGAIDGDTGVSTNRLQIGFGARFATSSLAFWH